MGKYFIKQVGIIKEGSVKQKPVFKLRFFVKETRYTAEMLPHLKRERERLRNLRKIK